MQETPGPAAEPEADAQPAAAVPPELSDQQLELVAGASDPFRFVRQILYAIFGFGAHCLSPSA